MTVSVTVDIDPWDVVDDIDEEELADYLRRDGWEVSREPSALEELDYEDLNYILSKIDDSDWQSRRTMDKIRKLRFG